MAAVRPSRVARALVLTACLAPTGALLVAAAQPTAKGPEAGSVAVVKAALSAVSLSDRENGEILGTALDIVDHPEAPGRRSGAEPGDAAQRLAVILAPGALDKLRRASEFRRVEPTADVGGERPVLIYAHDGPPAIRVIVTEAPVRAIIEVSGRP